MTLRLDIAIGPVQGFVIQSRRTRDLWGSSYLLSFLAGHAMHGAEKAGGRVVRPVVKDDPLYRWTGGDRTGAPPDIGSLPNRFAIDVEAEAEPVARAAVAALRGAWTRVCDAVWVKFIAEACEHGAGTRAIWDRQVATFWEVAWCAGPAEAGLLARRKHWRSHLPPTEPGDKCTVMHDLQEISGYVRSTGRADTQDCFWRHLRDLVGALDLRENERLCAVALIKRLLPRVAEDALGWKVERSRWPSTVHIAARPWLHQVENCAPDLARDYAEQVTQFAPSGVLSERWPDRERSAAGDFSRLDANWFHPEAIESEQLCPLNAHAVDGTRAALAGKLKAICCAEGRDGRRLGPPSSFYALLLADGDRLGRLVGEADGEQVGRALATFMEQAPKIVCKNGGQTVYAGGDDVLAMLPVPGALPCAEALAECYRSAFGHRVGATLSASVTFVHIRYPLSGALRDAHRLLDDIAKQSNGRDSLAVGVLKSGGLNSQWVTTWRRQNSDGCAEPSTELIRALADRLESDAPEADLSSGLLYRLRELLVRLGGWNSWRPGTWGTIPEDIDLTAFLRTEIGHSLAVRRGESAAAPAAEMAGLVVCLLQRVPADGQGGETTEIGVDALLLARFLAGGGHGEREA